MLPGCAVLETVELRTQQEAGPGAMDPLLRRHGKELAPALCLAFRRAGRSCGVACPGSRRRGRTGGVLATFGPAVAARRGVSRALQPAPAHPRRCRAHK